MSLEPSSLDNMLIIEESVEIYQEAEDMSNDMGDAIDMFACLDEPTKDECDEFDESCRKSKK